MLYDGVEFSSASDLPPRWSDAVFRFCTFEDLDIEGVSFDGTMLWSTLRRVRLYWGHFNTAALVQVRFEGCIFPATSFRGCVLADCTFTGCNFTRDNVGGTCVFDDCLLTECLFEQCRVDADGRSRAAAPSTNRIHGCRQAETTGLATLLPGIAGA